MDQKIKQKKISSESKNIYISQVYNTLTEHNKVTTTHSYNRSTDKSVSIITNIDNSNTNHRIKLRRTNIALQSSISHIPRNIVNINTMSYKFRILTSRTETKNKIAFLSCSISDKSICYSIFEQCSITSVLTISYNSHQTYNSTAITTLESVRQSLN